MSTLQVVVRLCGYPSASGVGRVALHSRVGVGVTSVSCGRRSSRQAYRHCRLFAVGVGVAVDVKRSGVESVEA